MEAVDPYATPQERRHAFLRNAAAAQKIAAASDFTAIRERYSALAIFWTTLANDVRELTPWNASGSRTSAEG